MANVLDELLVKLGFAADVTEAQIFNNQLNKILTTTAKIGATMTATGALFAAAVKGVVLDTASEFEQFETQLTTIEGSAERARKSLDWISDFGARTPYDVAEVTEAFVKLKSYGLDPINDNLLESLGNTASAMGKSLEQAVEAIADAVRGENERLKEFGIVGNLNGNKVSYTYDYNGESFTKEVNKDTKEIQQALQEIFDQKFDGGMVALSKTWSGMLSNLGDQWTAFRLKISENGIFDSAKNRLKGVLDYLEDNAVAIERMATTIAFFISSIINVISLLLAPFVLLAKAVIAVNNAVVWFLQLINSNIVLKAITVFALLVTTINVLAASMTALSSYMAVAIVRIRLFVFVLALANTSLITFARTAVTNALLATKSFIAMARAMTLAQMRAMAWQYVLTAMTSLRAATSLLITRLLALNSVAAFTSTATILLRGKLNDAAFALMNFSLRTALTTTVSKAFTLSVGAMRLAVISLRTALSALFSPMALIAGVAFVIIDLFNFLRGKDSVVGKLAEGSPEVAIALETISEAVRDVIDAFTGSGDSSSELVGALSEMGSALAILLSAVIKVIAPIIVLLIKVLLPVITLIVVALSTVFKLVALILTGIVKTITLFVDLVVGAFTFLADTIGAIWNGLFDGVKSVFGGIVDFILNKIGVISTVIGGVAKIIGKLVQGDFGGAVGVGEDTALRAGKGIFNAHSDEYMGRSYDGRSAVRGYSAVGRGANVDSSVTQTITVNSAEEASLIASRTAQATRQSNLGYI